MPYYKRDKHYKGRYPRYKKVKRPMFGRLDKAAYSMAKKALSLINTEFKLKDTVELGLVIVDGVGVIKQLTNVAQGDTNVTREGNSIKIVSIYTKFMFHINASASSSQVRCMLILDTQTNGAIYTTDDLLESVANLTSLISPRNTDNAHRFRVLYDKMVVLNQNITAVSSTTRFLKVYKKVDLHMRYATNVGDITDLTQNSISVLLISNEATNTPTVDINFRLRFLDN